MKIVIAIAALAVLAVLAVIGASTVQGSENLLRDHDGDGCSAGRESLRNSDIPAGWWVYPYFEEGQGIERYGGNRTDGAPFFGNDRYDYFDTNRDGTIDLSNDVLGVINNYTPGGYSGNPVALNGVGFLRDFDRGGIQGTAQWHRDGPDSVIDLSNDILGIIQQNGHTCIQQLPWISTTPKDTSLWFTKGLGAFEFLLEAPVLITEENDGCTVTEPIICFQSLNFYKVSYREVVIVNGGQPDWVFAHELCHALQHDAVIRSFGPNALFDVWVWTPEGLEYQIEAATVVEGGVFVEGGEYVGFIVEDWAQACAMWLTRNAELETTAPVRYTSMTDAMFDLFFDIHGHN